jgi:serine/threonine protein kinase
MRRSTTHRGEDDDCRTCNPAFDRVLCVFTQVFLTSQHLSIAMEYAAGGDMFEYVVRKGGLRESEARWFFQQLIVAVDYIHRMV